MRAAFAEYGGAEVGTEGDSFFATFPSPAAAASAAGTVQAALDGGPMRVRIGIHAGLALVEEGGYVGLDVHRAARIAGVAHGGQVVLSDPARAHISDEVVDLGEHRLKDLSAPVRLFQLGQERFPPLRSLQRTNLPVPSTPFLGREDALAAVGELLAREDVRLVTLTGPGGIGKTRLALQAAAGAADSFADGVWWIPLAALEDPALVLATIAQTLQIGSAGGDAVAAALAERLAGRCVLIVIDNAEHLLPGVAQAIAQLGAIDGPRLCVTSRERLALPGEHVFPVHSLSEPDAVGLFIDLRAPARPGLCGDAGPAGALPSARQPPARDRARGGAVVAVLRGRARRAARPRSGLAQSRPCKRGAAPDAGGGDRLVLPPADGGGAAGLPCFGALSRRLHRCRARADRGDGRGYGRIAARQEPHSPPRR